MSLDALKKAVAEWRKADDAVRKSTAEPKWRNPHGKAIYDLNQWYGKAREEALREIKEKYETEIARLNSLRIEAEKNRPESTRGRPRRGERSDEVKIQAYLAIEAGESRTNVKRVLVMNDNDEFDALLQQGKDLHERNDW